MTSSPNDTMRVVVVGDCGVGKTSVINAFTGTQFSADYTHTVAVDYNQHSVVLHNGVTVHLSILDTSGDRTFPAITNECYSKADGFVFVYDVTKLDSLHALRTWLHEVNGFARCPTLPKILIGNKSDLRDRKTVSEAEAKEFGIPEGMRHFEVSACSNRNVEVAFSHLATDLRRHKKLGGIVPIGRKCISATNNYKQYSTNHIVEFTNCSATIPEYIRQLKILVVGAPRVGKTSLVNRFLLNDFEAEYKPTIRLEFHQKRVDVAKRSMAVHVIDCSGDDQFEDTRRSYYRGINAFVVVYDVTNKQSFRVADDLIEELREFKVPADVPKILVGNKCDMDRKRAVKSETAKTFAEIKDVHFVETSCKIGHRVDQCFGHLICAMLQKPTLWRNALNN